MSKGVFEVLNFPPIRILLMLIIFVYRRYRDGLGLARFGGWWVKKFLSRKLERDDFFFIFGHSLSRKKNVKMNFILMSFFEFYTVRVGASRYLSMILTSRSAKRKKKMRR